MICPTCGSEIKHTERRPRWFDDLRYLARMKKPIWGNPLKRGVNMLEEDADLAYLVAKGYARQIDQEGFVVTDLGHEFLAKMK